MTESRTHCSRCKSESPIIACLSSLRSEYPSAQNLIDTLILPNEVLNKIEDDCTEARVCDSDLASIHSLQYELYKYQNNLLHFKKILNNSKEALISDISIIFNEVTDWLVNLAEEVEGLVEKLNSSNIEPSAEAKHLVETYRSKGFGEIVPHYLQEVNIDIKDILNYVKSKFNFLYDFTSEIKLEDDEDLLSADYSANLASQSLLNNDQASEDMNKNIANYMIEIAYKDDLIKDYYQALQKLTSSIAQYEQTVADQAREINHLNTSCLNYESENNKLKTYINSRQVQPEYIISKLERTKKKLKISDKKLKNELRRERSHNRHINKLESDIEELKSSHEDTTGFLNNQIEEMRIEIETLRNYKSIQDTFNWHDYFKNPISTRDDNLCIYIPQHFTKRLLKMNVISGKVEIIDMNIIKELLFYTSTCILENGDLIFARNRPASTEVYLLKTQEYHCIQLANLNSSRSHYTLFYYKGFVYAFGGKDIAERILKSAERLRVDRYDHAWEKLPNMKSPNMVSSCVGINDRIYLFDGCSNVLNFLDLTSLRFNLSTIRNIETEPEGIAYKYNDRIYLLTANYTQVYDLNLNQLYNYQNSSRYKRGSMNNLVSYNNTIYFYNIYTLALERLSIPYYDLQYPIINKYVYKTRSNYHDLHRIDVETHKIEVLDLSNHLHSKFYDTSVTILPNGDVFVAGFRCPLSEACYIINFSTSNCIRIQNMLTPRYFMSLLYHEGSIYAFGGQYDEDITLTAAEKFILSNGRWEKLPNMMKRRKLASSIGIDQKIYIFGGDHESIEIYDIISNKFTLSSVSLYCDVIAVTVNEVIYFLGMNDYSILSKDLNILEQTETITSNFESIYSLGNSATYKDYIYFYNNSRRILERMNIQTRERGIVIIE